MTAHWSDSQAKTAAVRGKIIQADEPRAKTVRYDSKSGRIVVDLANGCIFAFPARRVQGLENADTADIAAVELAGAGFALHWPGPDVDISLSGLMNGVFGAKSWMRELARRAGQSRSPAKAAAARENGQKGGRPRKAG